MLARREVSRRRAGRGASRPAVVAARARRPLELPPIAWAVDFRLVRREERVVVRWEPPAAGGGEHCEDERVAGVDHCSRFAFSFLLNAHSAHSRVMQAGGLRLGGRQAAGRHDHRPSAKPYSPSPNPSPGTRAGEHASTAGAAGVVQRHSCELCEDRRRAVRAQAGQPTAGVEPPLV